MPRLSPPFTAGRISNWDVLNQLWRRLQSFLLQVQKQVENNTSRVFVYELKAEGTNTGGIVLHRVLDRGPGWIILDCVLEVTATAPTVLDLGVTSDPETGDDRLLSAVSISSTGLTASSSTPLRVDPGEYLIATTAASPTGLTGNLYITYTRAGVGVT